MKIIMTNEEFDRKCVELIDKIQDLKTEAMLAQFALDKLREEYRKQSQEARDAHSAENFKKFAWGYNKKIKEDAAE